MTRHYKSILKLLIIIASLAPAACRTDGSFVPRGENPTRPGDDPCKPLYWYPRNIPAYCYISTTQRPKPIFPPVPVPVPIPAPPFPPPPMFPPPTGSYPQPIPIPVMAPPIPLPFGVPLVATNPIIPVAGIQQYSSHFPAPAFPGPPPPLQYPEGYSNIPPIPIPSSDSIPLPNLVGSQRQIGMVPGIPGMVSHDGGINILPFSDAYADLLEKHKQKKIRRRLQKFLDEYERYA